MPLDSEKLQNPFRRLTKSLKNMSSRPSPDEAQDLRTRSRKLEAIVHALLAESADSEFGRALGEAKDAIGEWHDWTELKAIAAEVLDYEHRNLLEQIRLMGEKKLDHALSVATGLRKKYLAPAEKSGRPGRRKAASRQPVVITTAKLVA